MHLPINHRLRPLYRFLAGLIGLYVLAFGIIGLIRTWGDAFFGQENLPRVLGLSTNPAFSLLSIGMGLLLLVALVLGNNIDHYVNLAAGAVFVFAGLLMMTLLRTDLNLLGFSMTNVVVSLIFGMLMITTGLYTRVGPAEEAEAEEEFRRGVQRAQQQAGQRSSRAVG